MKLSRNALGNLANRYRAVLRKCRLLNTFGILLLAGCCVVGRGGAVSAEPLYGQKETSQNASVTGGTVSTDQGASGVFGGYSYYYESWPWGSYSNSATGNSVTITGGTYTSERTEAGDNIAVAGGYANRNADGNFHHLRRPVVVCHYGNDRFVRQCRTADACTGHLCHNGSQHRNHAHGLDYVLGLFR